MLFKAIRRTARIQALLAGTALIAATAHAQELDRSVLPIQLPKPPTSNILDVRDVKAPMPVTVTAPKGAPNVPVILIDDMGFGASRVFGGPFARPVSSTIC